MGDGVVSIPSSVGTSAVSALLSAAASASTALDGVSAVCAAARDAWGADRVSIWVFDLAARTASPLAGSQPRDEVMAFARRWARTPLEHAPVFAEVADASRSVELEGASLRDGLPAGFAEDFDIRSGWVTPLRDGELHAMLCVEPVTVRPEGPALLEALPVIALVAARAVAVREAKLRDHQLDLLMSLAQSILAQSSVSDTLTDACERLARTVRARRSSVWILREERLVPVTAGYADGHRDSSGFTEFRSAEAPGIVRDVLASGEPKTLVGDELDPWWREVFDLGSVLAVPIGVHPNVTGVLVIDRRQRRGYDDQEVRLAAAVAANLATLLELVELSQLRERELEALKEAGEVKNVFLSAVSHELRTPLTVIRGLSDTLHHRGSDLGSAVCQDLVTRLHHNSLKLERLLLDLLDVDRLARKHVEPNRVPTDVAQLVTETAGAFEHPLHTFDLQLMPVVADIDPSQVERIVENLLSNACKYSPPGTHIDVRVTGTEEGVRIEVADRGPGVPAHARDSVFEPFHRLDDTHPSPGTGVGLALVSKFAALHGGTVRVDDRPGGGASFVVELPSDPAPSRAEAGTAGVA